MILSFAKPCTYMQTARSLLIPSLPPACHTSSNLKVIRLLVQFSAGRGNRTPHSVRSGLTIPVRFRGLHILPCPNVFREGNISVEHEPELGIGTVDWADERATKSKEKDEEDGACKS